MALKKAGMEPTVARVIAKCLSAASNPSTGLPFKSICYDKKPSKPWEFTRPYQKTALPEAVIAQRLAWAKKIKKIGRSPAWFLNNCVWIDPCNTVIPAAKRTVFD